LRSAATPIIARISHHRSRSLRGDWAGALFDAIAGIHPGNTLRVPPAA